MSSNWTDHYSVKLGRVCQIWSILAARRHPSGNCLEKLFLQQHMQGCFQFKSFYREEWFKGGTYQQKTYNHIACVAQWEVTTTHFETRQTSSNILQNKSLTCVIFLSSAEWCRVSTIAAKTWSTASSCCRFAVWACSCCSTSSSDIVDKFNCSSSSAAVHLVSSWKSRRRYDQTSTRFITPPTGKG